MPETVVHVGAGPRAGRGGERGSVLLILLVAGAVALLIGVTLFFLVVGSLSGQGGAPGGAGAGDPAATGGGDPGASGGEVPPEVLQEMAAGGAGLVCAYIPGIGLPRTNALDRRVMRYWLAVKQDLDAQGLRITANWGFRTTCQQTYVKSGGNLKAKVGSSPHEAGRAIDINGMKVRPDRFQVIGTFKRNGWRWLGRDDPPHFDIQPEQVGEGSGKIGWIRKQQANYQAGQPAGGCRGTPCGGVSVP